MSDYPHKASQRHLNAKHVFPTFAAAKRYCKRIRSKHRNDHKAFVPVYSPAGWVIGTRELHPRSKP